MDETEELDMSMQEVNLSTSGAEDASPVALDSLDAGSLHEVDLATLGVGAPNAPPMHLPRRSRSRSRATAVKEPAWAPVKASETKQAGASADETKDVKVIKLAGASADETKDVKVVKMAGAFADETNDVKVVELAGASADEMREWELLFGAEEAQRMAAPARRTRRGDERRGLSVDELIERAASGVDSVLDLTRRDVRDDVVIERIAPLLARPLSLTTITLTRNLIGDDGAAALARALRDACVPLARLDLNQNQIGEPGALALLGELEAIEDYAADEPLAPQSLTRLDLSWNGDIVLATKVRIAEAMLRNVRRRAAQGGADADDASLYLHGQALGDDGIVALANALAADTVVRMLQLGDNDLRERGGAALLRLLETNFTLTHVDLDENYDLPLEARERVAACVVRNRGLGALYLARYRLEDGPPVHRSATAEVGSAVVRWWFGVR